MHLGTQANMEIPMDFVDMPPKELAIQDKEDMEVTANMEVTEDIEGTEDLERPE